MTIPVTLIVPVKNDAGNLAACLPLLKDFDEVIVVDSGSTDETAKVVAENGRTIVQFAWNGQFPKKRNWALRNLAFKHPWVMFLDADERMTPAFEEELVAFLNSEDAADVDVLSCYFDNWFAGGILRHGDPMHKTAIVRVGAAEYEKIDEDHWSNLDMEIHEHLQPKREGAEHDIKARLEHHDKRSLGSHWRKHIQYAEWERGRYQQLMKHPERWESLTTRQKKKYANITKWWLSPAYFVMSYFVKLGCLDGLAGLRFAWFKMRYFRMVRAKILAAQRNR